MKLIEVSDSETLENIYKFRIDVWLKAGHPPELLPSKTIWKDECDDNSFHWAVVADENLLASARMSVHNSLADVPHAEVYATLPINFETPIASINRLIIHESVTRIGLSKKFDEARLAKAASLKCRTVVACVRPFTVEARLRSLLRQGFEIISPPNYYVEGFGNVTALALDDLTKVKINTSLT